jgi:hypothetical protein
MFADKGTYQCNVGYLRSPLKETLYKEKYNVVSNFDKHKLTLLLNCEKLYLL